MLAQSDPWIPLSRCPPREGVIVCWRIRHREPQQFIRARQLVHSTEQHATGYWWLGDVWFDSPCGSSESLTLGPAQIEEMELAGVDWCPIPGSSCPVCNGAGHIEGLTCPACLGGHRHPEADLRPLPEPGD